MNELQQLLELGWPGVVMMAAYVLWRAYVARTSEYINHLQSDVERLESRLRECARTNETLLGDILETVSLRKMRPGE